MRKEEIHEVIEQMVYGKLIEAVASFNVDGKSYKFKIIHNLSETFGLSFECALENWVYRTKKFTAESLCKYIKKKTPDATAITESQYKEVIQYVENLSDKDDSTGSNTETD